MHACYVTLRLRITVFEQVGLPYNVCNACTFVYTHCLCCFLFLFLFFLDLRYIRTFWMRFRIFVFPSDFRNKYDFFRNGWQLCQIV